MIDVVHERHGADIPDWKCLFVYYNLCVQSIVTPLSAAIMEMYHHTKGLANETYLSYLNLPAILADGCRIVSAELAQQEAVRERAEQAQLDRMMRRRHGNRR